MSTPTDSTAPVPVLTSDPAYVSDKTNPVRFSERVKAWIEGLSPSGASEYEQSNSGSLAGGYTGSWLAVRYGKLVLLTWVCTTSIAAGGTALPLLTLPSGWRPLVDTGAAVSGTSLYPWSGAVRTSGAVQVRNNHTSAQSSMFGTAVFRVSA